MPRYFFDYLNHPDKCDKVGIVLPDDAAAKREAAMRAMDSRSNNHLVPADESEIMAVRNEAGEQLCKVHIG